MKRVDDAKNTICPWCDTEIVWDPEIGPEDACPHCLNELTDYRQVELHLNAGAVKKQVKYDRSAESWDEEEFGESEDLIAYEEAVGKQIDEQEEDVECVSCQEPMVYAGDEIVLGSDFQSAKLAGKGIPLLSPPFRMQLFVCPSCFRTERLLGNNEREAWMARLSQR